MRFLPRHVHALMDYPAYIGMILFPILLGLGSSHPMAFLLPLVLGVAGLVMTALTDHETGLVAVISFSVHKRIEAIAALGLIVAAIGYGFTGIDLFMAVGLGAVLFGCAILDRPAPALMPAE
ncbi:MAG: hypothetical protein ABJQ34_03115 [Paracoccaceae bacterium]